MTHKSLTERLTQATRVGGFVGGIVLPKNSNATLAQHRQRAQSVTRRVPPRPAMGKRPR